MPFRCAPQKHLYRVLSVAAAICRYDFQDSGISTRMLSFLASGILVPEYTYFIILVSANHLVVDIIKIS